MRSPPNLLTTLRDREKSREKIVDSDGEKDEGTTGNRDSTKRRQRQRQSEVLLLPPDIKDYDITGTLFKRRGGIGRILGWKPRLFTLFKGKLSYYEGELIEEVDRRKPRGVYDLTSKGVAYILHEPAKHENAPTEFLFSIVSQHDDQKWRICAPSKDDLEDWCKVLGQYLGEAANPEDFVHQEHEGSGIRWPHNRRRSTAEEPTSPTGHGVPAFDTVGFSTLRHRRSKSHVGEIDESRHPRGVVKKMGSDDGPSSPSMAMAVTTFSLNKFEIGATLFAANVVLLAMRLAHPLAFVVLAVAVNMVMAEGLAISLWGRKLTGIASRALKLGLVDPVLVLLEFIPLGPNHSLAAGEKAHAATGGAAAKVEIILPSKVPPVGSTVVRVAPGTPEDRLPEHSWTPGSASSIRVRGLTYKKDQKKEASAPALYDLISFDFYRSAHRVSNVGSLVPELPKVHREGLPPHVPKLLIINWQAPSYSPGIRAQEDGEGFSCVMYFAIKEETVEALKDLDHASAGVRLLSEFFRRVPEDSDMRNRFKAICVCNNMAELNVPSIIEGCNGKPILLKHTANYIRHNDYYEIDINMHKFAYPARKGIQILQPKFQLVAFESAFTIEGRNEEELPEIVIGVGKFNKMDVAKGHVLQY